MKIVFQNSHFVALDKDSGTLTVPSRLAEKDARPVLGLLLQEKFQKKIFPVHRLDYEVSGLVLFALNAEAHREASSWFAEKQVTKTYRALTGLQNFDHWPAAIPCDRREISEVMEEDCLWTCRLLRGKKRSYESPHGDLAETRACLLKIDKDHSRAEWRLQPLTGRSHQLRFELSRHGFPILGDHLYGSKAVWSENKIALRSIILSLKNVNYKKFDLPEVLEVSTEIEGERN